MIVENEDNRVLRHFKISFGLTTYFYWNSIIFYQYFTVVIACFLQFLDLNASHSSTSAFSTISSISAFIAFLFVTVYPIVNFMFMRSRKTSLITNHEDSNEELVTGTAVFKNKYAEVFFRFMKLEKLPVYDSHLLYNTFRFGELWWIGIVAIAFYDSGFTQAFLLVILNGLHFFFVLFSSFNTSKRLRILKALELFFFLGLETLILIMLLLTDSLTSTAFLTLGIVGIVFIFAIVFTSLFRVFVIWRRIYLEYDDPEKPSLRRNLNFYDD